MGRYRAGAVSGISVALACFACLAGGPWSRWHESGRLYVAGAVLDGLVAFIAATWMYGRRGGSSAASRALSSMAFGWAAAVAGVIFAFVAYLLVLFVLLALFVLSGAPATG